MNKIDYTRLKIMTIRRPNVRARLYQPNLQARHPGNQKYYPRDFRMYSKQCRWCKRPASGRMFWDYPGLCLDCGAYLWGLENQATTPHSKAAF